MRRIRQQVYESIEEMVEACDAAYKAGRSHGGFDRSRFIGRAFTGWDDVVAKVGEYWPEGLDLVQEMLFELRNVTGQARPKSRVRRGRWSADDGDEIDVDRLRAGQDCWRQTVREEHDAPQTLVPGVLALHLGQQKERGNSLAWRRRHHPGRSAGSVRLPGRAVGGQLLHQRLSGRLQRLPGRAPQGQRESGGHRQPGQRHRRLVLPHGGLSELPRREAQADEGSGPLHDASMKTCRWCGSWPAMPACSPSTACGTAVRPKPKCMK